MTMNMKKPVRMLGATIAVVAAPLAWGVAQTQSPAPPQPSAPPSVVKPETNTPQAQKEVLPPTGPSQSKMATPAANGSLVGLTVLSSDGTNLGNVRSVKGTAILLKTGGFLGFGGHVVAIPTDKLTRAGDTVRVSMTKDEVSKLPAASE